MTDTKRRAYRTDRYVYRLAVNHMARTGCMNARLILPEFVMAVLSGVRAAQNAPNPLLPDDTADTYPQSVVARSPFV